jgi:hypothetical protein
MKKTHKKTNNISNKYISLKPLKLLKSSKTSRTIYLNSNQVEFLLLLNTLILISITLKYKLICNASNINSKQIDDIIHKKLLIVLKKIRKNNKYIPKNISSSDLNNFVDKIIKYTKYLEIDELKNVNNNNNDKIKKHHGGFFFKNIEDKAEQPITGADVSKLLDEIQQFFYNAQYVTEGQFLQDTNTVLSMLRGDTQQFKSILQYRIFPKYYQSFPPFIKWDGINEAIQTKKWEDIPDYLLAYQTYLKLQDEYLVEKGLKPPSVLNKDLYTGFYNKLSNTLNDEIYKYQSARRTYNGQFYPITAPN